MLNRRRRVFIFAAKEPNRSLKVKTYGQAIQQSRKTQTARALFETEEGNRKGEGFESLKDVRDERGRLRGRLFRSDAEQNLFTIGSWRDWRV